VTQPGVKKDSQGRWVITGVEENSLSQQQADAMDIRKSAQLLTGQQGELARQLLKNAPELSGGLLAGLVKIGAAPNNQLVKNLASIDEYTKVERARDQFDEAAKLANEKFNNTIRGKLWRATKSTTRAIGVVSTARFDIPATAARLVKQSFDAYNNGDIDFWTGTPTDPNKTRADLGLPTGILNDGKFDAPQKILSQMTLAQTVKDMITEKKIDLGNGFFASEESGAGFAAREAQKRTAKITYTVDGQTVERPYSFFDPVTSVITGGRADTGTGAVITAVGDLIAMIVYDPFLAYGRMKKARDAAALAVRTSSGMKSAKALKDLSLLDSQLEEAVNATKITLADYRSVAGGNRSEKERAVADAIDNQLRIAEKADAIEYNLEDVASFLSGSKAKEAIDTLAQMDDWRDIYALGKRFGRKGGFSVEQSLAVSKATTREEVLEAIAPYIANGQVVADALETGSKVSRTLSGASEAVNSKVGPTLTRITKGTNIVVTNKIVGLAASGYQKVPYLDKLTKTLAKSWSNALPTGGLVHSADKENLVDAVISYGRAANLSETTIRDIVDVVARSEDVSATGYAASARLFDEIFKANVNLPGIDKEYLKEITRIFEGGRSQMSSYWADMHAKGAKIDYILADKRKVTISGAHLDSEYLNSMIYFPPIKEILKELSVLQRRVKLGEKGIGRLTDVAETFTNNFWKRLILIRPAYIIRNIAEEQIRVLGTGHISFFNNPLTATAMWLGRDGGSKWREVLNRFDPYSQTVMGTNFKLSTAEAEFAAEVLAHDAAESYIKSQSIRGVSGIDTDVRGAMAKYGFQAIQYGHQSGKWWEGLASELRILSNSIVGRAVARTAAGKEQATVDFLLRGLGKDEYLKFAKGQPEEISKWLLTDEGAMNYLFTGKNLDEKLTSVAARIEQAAGRGGVGSAAIRQLISYGAYKSEGLNLAIPKGVDSARNSIKNANEMSKGRKALKDANQEFAEQLKNAFDGKGDWSEITMNVPLTSFAKRKEKAGLFKDISDSFFQTAIKFEKTSTMGPEWRQKYWDAIYDISRALDAEAVAKLKVVAQDSLTPLKNFKGKPIGSQHKVWKAFENVSEDGNITSKEAHEYASTVASKHVAELFYDASRKRLLFHQLRLIAPFGQAWEDTIKAWGRIALNNPVETYKISKGLNWLTNPSSSALYQLTDAKDYYDPNQGFFFNDPKDGQRKFFIPFMSTGLNFLTNLSRMEYSTAGPVASTATPQSFNFAFASGSIIPGVGPGISITVAVLDKYGVNPLNLLPQTFKDIANKIIFPFGEPDFSKGFAEALLPGNIRRTFAPIMPDTVYATALAPTMNYLARGGNYNLDDPTDQQQLIIDSDKFAKWFTVMRGVLGSFSAFPINIAGVTTLDDGNTVLSTALYNDFKTLEVNAGGNSNKAYADFLDLYGPETIFAIIATSTGAPTNLFTYELIKKDPSVVTDYKDTYGYIYPNGGFSQELYRWQQRVGNKEKLNSTELLQRATQLRYYAAKDRLMTRSAAEGWSKQQFTDVSQALTESYAIRGLTSNVDYYKDKRIQEQLVRLTNDSRFDDSDAVQGLKDYLYLYNKALEASGMKSLANKASAPQREWLSAQALDILKRNPEFQKMFYAFFEKELKG